MWLRTVALSLPRSTRTSCRFPSRILIHRLNPCVINGTDMWTELKKSIGTTREISLIVHGMVTLFDWGADDKTVEELNVKYNTGKCEWIYEIEGFWSSCIRHREGMSYSRYHGLCDFRFGSFSCCCCIVRVCQQASSGEAQFSSRPFFDRPREESVSRVVCPILVEDASFCDSRNTALLTSQRNSPHPRDTVPFNSHICSPCPCFSYSLSCLPLPIRVSMTLGDKDLECTTYSSDCSSKSMTHKLVSSP